MKPPLVTDEELVLTAEAYSARHGKEEGEKLLRFLRERRRISEKYPLTDDEAMELAVSELHAMRAERDQKVKARG